MSTDRIPQDQDTDEEILYTHFDPEGHTIYSLFQCCVLAYHNMNLFGQRRNAHTTMTRVCFIIKSSITALLRKGEFQWLTYGAVNELVTYLGSGLVSLGLKPQDHVSNFICIL